MTGSRILALGHYQPGKVLTNDDLAKFVDTNDEWIRSRVGIRARHVAAGDETVDMMAAHAAAKALAACSTPRPRTSTSSWSPPAPPSTGCRAWPRGSPNGSASPRPPPSTSTSPAPASPTPSPRPTTPSAPAAASRALVIAAEKLTGVTDWNDRSTAVLTGDGAGAAVVAPAAGPGDAGAIGPVVWGSAPEMGSAVRIEGSPPVFAQEGQAVYRWAVKELPPIVRRVCERGGVAPTDLAAIVLHQANLRIIEPLARSLGAPQAVVATDVTESGNTSGASVPLAFSKLVARGEVESGAPVLLFAFGGNLSYAGQVVRCP